MSVDETTKLETVESAIREISHIATLPEITMKVIELVEDPSSTAQDLHGVIANDPALCSRVLKVVNSAFYGLPGQIGSINRAIVLLGLNAVKNIAIAASLSKLFRGGALTPNFSARDLWDHSLSNATAAKMIAEALKLGLTDEAFLSGLIHDIGIIVEIQYDRNRLIDVVNRVTLDDDGAPTVDMRTIETEIFGANHEDFGLGLCEKWKFPRTITTVSGNHHRPLELSEDNRTMSCIVALADRIVAQAGVGFRLDVMDQEMSSDLLDAIKLSREKADEIVEKFPAAYESMGGVMS